MKINDLSYNATGARYGYNSQEQSTELNLDGNHTTAEFWEYDARSARRWDLDPLRDEFPYLSNYSTFSLDPINRVDPNGAADYYKKDGNYLGNDKVNDNRTMLADNILSGPTPAGQNDSWRFTKPVDLKIGHDTFLGFASAIHNERGVRSLSKEEALTLGSVMMNKVKIGGYTNFKTLDDFVMYDNYVVQGATQEHYSEFKQMDSKKKNSRYALTSAINAIMFRNGLPGGVDYSSGADSWDGWDLVDKRYSSSHRDYIWTLDSKKLIEEYISRAKYPIPITRFKFSDRNPGWRVVKIVGETLFELNLGGKGGIKQKPERFK